MCLFLAPYSELILWSFPVFFDCFGRVHGPHPSLSRATASTLHACSPDTFPAPSQPFLRPYSSVATPGRPPHCPSLNRFSASFTKLYHLTVAFRVVASRRKRVSFGPYHERTLALYPVPFLCFPVNKCRHVVNRNNAAQPVSIAFYSFACCISAPLPKPLHRMGRSRLFEPITVLAAPLA